METHQWVGVKCMACPTALCHGDTHGSCDLKLQPSKQNERQPMPGVWGLGYRNP